MEQTRLTIRAGDQSWEVDLNPEGTVLGRNSACDVVIDRREVSRRHAKVFWKDPGGWTIQNLSTSNGTLVNGRRVEMCRILPGDVIEVGPICLSLGSTSKQRIAGPPQSQGPEIIVEDFGAEVFYDGPRLEECSDRPCPARLDQAGQRLAGLTDLKQIYAEVCRLVADGPKTAAVVLRLPSQDSSLPKNPEILACHFGLALGYPPAGPANKGYPSHRVFRVSHRLLEAVRQEARPLMAKSVFSCDTEITISLIDEHSPRAVICVPLSSDDGFVDVLYVDAPLEEHSQVGPEERFVFVQAVARKVRATRSSAWCDLPYGWWARGESTRLR